MTQIPVGTDEAENIRHREKARKHKAARDKIMASKTGEKGLLIVHTGTGKGKTSAALGMVFRHIGHGYPVGIVQFTKSPSWDTGEARVLAKFPDLVTLHIMGEGFTWETQDRERDIAAATKGWERAKELIRDDRHRMVLLDELNIVLRYDYLPIEAVLRFLRDEKPADKHVVVTGRNAHPSLIELADLVTEMTLIKHGCGLVPCPGPARLEGGAIQVAEHVEQCGGRDRGRRDRPGAGGAGPRGKDAAQHPYESGAAEAGDRYRCAGHRAGQALGHFAGKELSGAEGDVIAGGAG